MYSDLISDCFCGLFPVKQYSGPQSAWPFDDSEFPVMAGLLSADEILCGFFIIKVIGYKSVVRIVQKVNPVGFCPCVCHFFHLLQTDKML